MNGQLPEGVKVGRFRIADSVFIGLVRGDEVVEVRTTSMLDLVDGGIIEKKRKHSLSELRVLPPVDKPSKIICIGLNYRSHIKEMEWETPKTPIIFSKPSSSIIGPEDEIVLPPTSSRVDYEGESAIVIGRRAHHVRNGSSCILGYTCLNDVTARDLQKIDPDWTRAKGFDTFAPIGPFLTGSCPRRLVTRLNGKTVQDAFLTDRVFDDKALVEYVSSVMTLEPGDVIATGTPSGISEMRAGDSVEVELDTVGVLRNKVVKSL